MREKIESMLMNTKNITEFVTMFFGLSVKEQLSVFGEDYIIPKGTKLYRVRQDDGITNFESVDEWGPPPAEKIKQGRFNLSKTSVLYVASNSSWLEREIGLKEGEPYYLATYVCNEDISVGNMLNANSLICCVLHTIAKAIENTDCLTAEELSAYNKIKISNINAENCILNMIIPFYIHKEVKNIYDITNKIGNLIMRKNSNGIRYCSAFMPFETMRNGTIFALDELQDANFVLTEKCLNKIEFKYATPKKCSLEHRLDIFFETINEMSEKNV